MKKTFDCAEMKRKVQDQTHEETRRLSRKQEPKYFHAAAEALRREIESPKKEPRAKWATDNG